MPRWFKRMLWCFVGCAALWAGGLYWFMSLIPQTAPPLPAADAIVILTGGKGRTEYGFRLLAEGKGRYLFVSGVGGNARVASLAQQLPGDLRDVILQLPTDRITLGHQAENTIGNAEETARWARIHEIKSLIIVTANYHLPRGLSEFSALMPSVQMIGAPVFPEETQFSLILSEYHKFLAGKFRHWLMDM